MDAPGAVVHLQRQHTSLLRRLSQALTLGAFKSTACNIHDWLRPGEFSPQELMVSAAFATPVEELRTVQRPAQPTAASCQSLQNFSNPNKKVCRSLPIHRLAPRGEVVTRLTLIML